MYNFRKLLRSDRNTSNRGLLALAAGIALLIFVVWPIPQYSTPALAFTVFTTLQVRHDDFLEDFGVLADYIRYKEPYTFVLELLRRSDDESVGDQFVILERYRDRETWQKHTSSAEYQAFQTKLKQRIESGDVQVLSDPSYWDTALGFEN